jgi:hypothetical protein
MQHTATPRSKTLSLPRMLLHLEGVTVFIGAIILYAHLRGDALPFIALLFSPDLSMLGYLMNARVGAVTYNIAHLYALPIALAALGLASQNTVLVQLALIWFAHIGMDRTVGYGFKYPNAFKDTHLQRV